MAIREPWMRQPFYERWSPLNAWRIIAHKMMGLLTTNTAWSFFFSRQGFPLGCTLTILFSLYFLHEYPMIYFLSLIPLPPILHSSRVRLQGRCIRGRERPDWRLVSVFAAHQRSRQEQSAVQVGVPISPHSTICTFSSTSLLGFKCKEMVVFLVWF